MIYVHPGPWQYFMTVCVLHDNDLHITLALAIRHDCMCLHDDLYRTWALAICLNCMCLHDDLYTPCALTIHHDRMCPPWWSVYNLGLGSTSWPHISPWWSAYTLGLGNTSDCMHLHNDPYIHLASAIHQIVCISITIRIYPSPQQYIMTVCLHDDLYIPLAVAIRLDRMCLCDNDLHWSKGVAYVLIYISHWYVYRDVTFLILQVHGDLMNQFWKEIKIHNAVCSPKLYMMGSKVLKIQTLIHMT